MRRVLIVGAGGFVLAAAGVAWALLRWDFTMEGKGETWIDFFPIPMVLLGVPVALVAAVWCAVVLAVRLLGGEAGIAPADRSGQATPPDDWVPPSTDQIAAVVRGGRPPVVPEE